MPPASKGGEGGGGKLGGEVGDRKFCCAEGESRPGDLRDSHDGYNCSYWWGVLEGHMGITHGTSETHGRKRGRYLGRKEIVSER